MMKSFSAGNLTIGILFVSFSLSAWAAITPAKQSLKTAPPVGVTKFTSTNSTALKIIKEETRKEAAVAPVISAEDRSLPIETSAEPIARMHAQLHPSAIEGLGQANEIILDSKKR